MLLFVRSARGCGGRFTPATHVDAAFFLLVLLPPPAARASGFARLDRAGARCAADARVALVVQLAVGHVVRAYVVPDFLLGPLDERVELDQVVGLVLFAPLH